MNKLLLSDTKLRLPEDILEIIWKTYYSHYILPIIKNRQESKLYLEEPQNYTYNFALSPNSYNPSGSVNLSKTLILNTKIEYEYDGELVTHNFSNEWMHYWSILTAPNNIS